jgi:DNA-3-methyladenine glycosylase I
MQAMAGFGLSKSSPAVVAGSDRVTRCAWATETGRDLTVHHDSSGARPRMTGPVSFASCS